MTDKQIIIDGVSNFCLVCYYDNRTNELVRIEHYEDNSGDMKSDIDSYKYGYNAEIIKPEQIIKQLKRSEAQCEAMFVSHTDLEKKYKAKEQECERLKKQAGCYSCGTCNGKEDYRNLAKHHIGLRKSFDECHKQLDQLKTEVKSNTEYIQEQREIIDQYSKEIEMYKKCQGKRASKREEELKAENERLEYLLYDRALQTLEDIEIIAQQGIDFFNETERHADWEKVAIFMKQQLSFILGEMEEG